MLNITGNSIKYVKNGTIKIILTKVEYNTISIEIQDNGCGIKESKYLLLYICKTIFNININYKTHFSEFHKI